MKEDFSFIDVWGEDYDIEGINEMLANIFVGQDCWVDSKPEGDDGGFEGKPQHFRITIKEIID